MAFHPPLPLWPQIASASLDKTVRIWDAKTDRQLAVLKGHSGVFASVMFSPDGLLMASGSVR